MMNIIMGTMLLILGYKVLFIQKFNARGGVVDFTNPYLHIPLSILLFITGLAFLYLAFRPKSHIKPQKDILVSICPNCEKTYYYKNLKNGLCPKCNIQTITIEKYNKQVKKYNKKQKQKQKQKESSTKRSIKENPNKRLNLDDLNIKDIKIKKE